MSHNCECVDGNVGCSCYNVGKDQGAENVVNVFRQHQVQGFISNESGSGFVCSCTPGVPLNYSDHMDKVFNSQASQNKINEPLSRSLKNSTNAMLDLSPAPVVEGHSVTGEGVAGFLGRCTCGAAVDDFREHVESIQTCCGGTCK
jgi:hypothetical protein